MIKSMFTWEHDKGSKDNTYQRFAFSFKYLSHYIRHDSFALPLCIMLFLSTDAKRGVL